MSSSLPLISVLIPAYNHQNYIQECIESVICQDYGNLELIILDDGSSDLTWLKIIELEKKCRVRFSNFSSMTRQNKGIYETLNELIELSNGEYIYLLASDDRIQNEKAISTLYQIISHDDKIVLAVGDSEIIDCNSNRIAWDIKQNIVKFNEGYNTFWEYFCYRHPRVKKNSKDMKNFGSYRTLVKGNYIPNGYLIRAEKLKKIEKFTAKAPMEDWFMHLQLSKLGRYKFTKEILFSYRWHDENTIKNKKQNKIKNKITKRYFGILCFLYKFFKKEGLKL
ncbi:TPA: glycosyltransferase family 2 protein [Campylobacter coli]|nr:glycosyltransferase family 2 protein [Campylobacter coli]EKA3831584.1 glycosyltransferase family 2 protein [Campylobacter coli]HEC1858536.1 glycosyltransferase family 2 protein [Campylobacter coli]HEC1862111.1 glycosyltransferase family 2 protein [Campylobacter coli]HEC1865710.1 glycosyltransferase family 2 protein [Campylobacter coli]